jgi:hypothetical protein
MGAVYIFENQISGWTQTQKLLPGDGQAADLFGRSVCISGSSMLIGSGRSKIAPHSGVVYSYTLNGSTWAETQEFWPDDSDSWDEFGNSISISGNIALIAAAGDDDAAGDTSGSAFVYVLQGSTWVQAGKLMATDAAPFEVFGYGVGVSGETALIGAPGASRGCTNCGMGAAYDFQLAPTAMQYGSCASGAPCGNSDTHGGCANSTGQGAILAACGSGSVSTDDLELQVTHCPANKSTLLFMGGGRVSAAFGDGLRVVSGGGIGVFRYGIAQSDANGMVTRGPGLVAASQHFHSAGRIQAGETWYFQVWYRDPLGPCGGLTNLSNGVQVSSVP